MSYHDTITSGPVCSTSNAELRVAWTSSSPPGTTFQVYVDRVLRWSGMATTVRLVPPSRELGVGAYVEVYAVDPGDELTDFSADFAALPSRRVTLRWSGGRWASMTLALYQVYMSAAPGGAIDYMAPVATIPWTRGPIPQDGAGIGRAGHGSAGYSEVMLQWTSPALRSGVWSFAIVPVDASGVAGTAVTTSETIASPPAPPVGLSLSVSSGSRIPTLIWSA